MVPIRGWTYIEEKKKEDMNDDEPYIVGAWVKSREINRITF